MTKTFSACEIIEMGIQIEKNGRDFYNTLEKLTDNAQARAMLRHLSNAEDEHIKVFSGIFSGVCDYDPPGAYPEEYFQYLNSLASEYVFTKAGEGEKAATLVGTYTQGLDLGISLEKDSILFYQEMKKFVPGGELEKIDVLIANEKEHLTILVRMKEEAKK